MQDGQHYKFLDFPPLPTELEQLCIDQTKKNDALLFKIKTEPVFEGNIPFNGKLVYKKHCVFECYTCPQEVRQWLFDHKIINTLDADIGVQRSYGGNALLPHIDSPYNDLNSVDTSSAEGAAAAKPRKIARNYLLTESGPATQFYNSPRIDDIIESVVIPKSVWHDLHVTQYHGVDNITCDRISLTISFF